jgi:hypothetical protein
VYKGRRDIQCYKSPANDDECGFCILNYSGKSVTGFVARNVMSDTTNYALVRMGRTTLFLVLVDASYQNCAK